MLPTLGNVFLLVMLVEGTFELLNGGNSCGMERVGGFVLLLSMGAPDNEAWMRPLRTWVPEPAVYLDIRPNSRPGWAIEGKVVDIEDGI